MTANADVKRGTAELVEGVEKNFESIHRALLATEAQVKQHIRLDTNMNEIEAVIKIANLITIMH